MVEPAEPPGTRVEVMVRYRMYAFYRAQILAMFGLFAVMAVGFVTAAAMSNAPLLVFAALWVAALLWNGYWFLLRLVYDLELDGDVIRWRTPLRSGTIAVVAAGVAVV